MDILFVFKDNCDSIEYFSINNTKGRIFDNGYPWALKSSNTLRVLAMVEDDSLNLLNLYSIDKNDGDLKYIKSLMTKAQLPNFNNCYSLNLNFNYPSISGMAFSENDSILYVGYTFPLYCNDALKFGVVIYQIALFNNEKEIVKKIYSQNYINNKNFNWRFGVSMFTGFDGNIYWGLMGDNRLNCIENANKFGKARVVTDKFVLSKGKIDGKVCMPIFADSYAGFDTRTDCAGSVNIAYFGTEQHKKLIYYWVMATALFTIQGKFTIILNQHINTNLVENIT